MATVNIVIMAKPAIPGCVKTRLIGRLCRDKAAEVHAAMLACVMERAGSHIVLEDQVNRILAIDNALRHSAISEVAVDTVVTQRWRQVDQGSGDLGQRLAWVWQKLENDPVVFLGADSPDVPLAVLGSIVPALKGADVAIGPVQDGGYWTLAARNFQPQLLASIDWGTSSVYHQTLAAAKQAGLSVASLEPWYDVDQFEDVIALRQRIDRTQESALMDLRSKLDCICQETSR